MSQAGPTPRPAASPRSTLPDLTILVGRESRDARTALTFTLVHRSPLDGRNFEEFGPQELDQEPAAYFLSLFEGIEKSFGARTPDPQLLAQRLAARGARLFVKLLPEELRQRLAEIRERVRTVQIFSDEPWIPWELLKFRGEPGTDEAGGPFFGEAFAITSWLRGTREALLLPVRHLALVVPGDSDLKHAREELADLLQHRGPERAVDEIAGRLSEVMAALIASRHDGWHFTGHGMGKGVDSQKWCLLLEEHEQFFPDDLYGDIHLHLRPLVFLNGCQTARTGFSLTGLGGWAEAFFAAGAGAFVGTYWMVGDKPASLFARTFYRGLFAGVPVGEAALQARLAVRESFPGDPSWLAYTVFAHPRAICRVPIGSAGLESRWQEAPPRIRDRILDFSRLVTEKTHGFVGRGWVFDELDRFLAEKPRGYFLLEGDPGIGKSSLMAELVRRRGLVHHFNQRGEATRTAEAFLANVCAQLIATYGLPYDALPPEATVNGRFLSGLLEQAAAGLAPGERIVLVVDSLDEAEAQTPLVGNLHFLPTHLPPGAYLVVSTRPNGPRLHLDVEQRTFTIRQDDQANLADVRELILSRMSPGLLDYLVSQRLDQADFVERMVERSQGNFMYLHHVLPEIESGAYRALRFNHLPEGLARYYEDHWQRMKALGEADWFDWKLPVLEALTVVKEPVSARLVARFAGVEDPRRVHSVLRDWREFLYETEVEDPEAGERQKRYRLYHASFQEFIADKDEVREERVRLKDRHGRIADLLWEDLFEDQAGSGEPSAG
jgi:CHAT domain/NACHT domain